MFSCHIYIPIYKHMYKMEYILQPLIRRLKISFFFEWHFEIVYSICIQFGRHLRIYRHHDLVSYITNKIHISSLFDKFLCFNWFCASETFIQFSRAVHRWWMRRLFYLNKICQMSIRWNQCFIETVLPCLFSGN